MIIICLTFNSSFFHLQVNFDSSSTITDKTNYLVELGAHLGVDAPAILWENGAGTFQSGSLTVQSMIDAAGKSRIYNFSKSGFSEEFADLPNSTSIICQSPIFSSFCLDSPSLSAAMAKNGEIFLPDNIVAPQLSSYSCIQFCVNQNANVRQIYRIEAALFI